MPTGAVRATSNLQTSVLTRQKGLRGLAGASYKDINLKDGSASSPHHPHKGLAPDPITLGIRISTLELGFMQTKHQPVLECFTGGPSPPVSSNARGTLGASEQQTQKVGRLG